MSKVVSMRLRDDQVERLARLARCETRTLAAMAALLIEKALRERAFPDIGIRDTAVGPQAFLWGTRLKVWQVVSLCRDYGGDVNGVAEHLKELPRRVEAALKYAETFPEEIDDAIKSNDKTYEELKELYPNIGLIEISATAS